MSFSRGLKAKAAKVWEDGYNHPFVQELGKGTLDKEKFKFYLLQDIHYLLQYAKVFAQAVVRAETEEQMVQLTAVQNYIFAGEMNVHREYMSRFGITSADVEAYKPSLYNRCYTSNMLAIGVTGSLAEILATILPCGYTYADYGQRLKKQYADRLKGNYYESWIEKYASDEFAGSLEWIFNELDNLVANMTDKQRERIEEIFISSVEFEYLFWDMSYKQQMSY
ncbi:MAG: thiaminase II [Spirochaetes bacterium]|nr:thiaminase II [Spirochaetota bacterium]